MLRVGEILISETVLKTYIQVTLDRLSRLYLGITVNEERDHEFEREQVQVYAISYLEEEKANEKSYN